ncbi:MAG: alpha/beta hydrolase [Pseudomonadota bacterium]
MSAANPYLDIETTAATRQTRHALQPPQRWLRYLEPRAAFETLALVPTSPLWATRQRGDGRQVMVIPGFMTDDGSTWPLRRYLTFLGYEALPWELGRNKGVPDKDAERLAERLDGVRRSGEQITLIGWSLGGVVARETARLRPDAVREVITMGTPVEGGPKYTIAAKHYAEERGEDLEAFEQYVHSVNSKGISQPLTVIYSESDGIVGWRAALDRYNPQARHIRVHGSHLGLGTNPQVWLAIEKTLRLSAADA